MSELKKCPFCKESVSIKELITDSKWQVVCKNCGYMIYGWGSEETLVAAWNSRPLEDALQAELEDMKRRLKEAEQIINRGIDIMTNEQCGQWDGVRGWLESLPELKEDK